MIKKNLNLFKRKSGELPVKQKVQSLKRATFSRSPLMLFPVFLPLHLKTRHLSSVIMCLL